MTKHYIEFYFQGTIFAETSVKEIKDRNEHITPPKGCYGYSFFDREEVSVNGEMLFGKPKNQSGTTFFGEKYSLDEVKKQFPQEKILISNLESNDYKYVVKTIRGNWVFFNKGDKVKSLVC